MAAQLRALLVPSLLLASLFILSSAAGAAGSEHALQAVPDGCAGEVPRSERDEAVAVPVEGSLLPEGHEPFIATDEWQVVKPNQAIPPGLHVQIDMQTGEKRAKLLPVEERDGVKLQSEKRREKLSKLMAPLMALDDGQGLSNASDISFQDYLDELKAVASQLLRSDAQLMKEMMMVFLDPVTPLEEQVRILGQLESFVHQIDNARDLDKLGILKILVSLVGEPTAAQQLREAAAHVLGAACQNNPPVQERAYQLDLVPRAVNQIVSGVTLDERKRALFLLSSLTRDYALAQDDFFAANGTAMLLQLLGEEEMPSTIKTKVFLLLVDLWTFQISALEGVELDNLSLSRGDNLERLLPFVGKTRLAEELVALDGCGAIVAALPAMAGSMARTRTFLEAVLIASPVCAAKFEELQLGEALAAVADSWETSRPLHTDPDAKEYLDESLAFLSRVRRHQAAPNAACAIGDTCTP